MAVLARLILILSLLLQSVPGLTVISCASMASGECQGSADAGTPAHKACSCCCAHKDSATSSGSAGGEAMTCCCEQTEPEKPASPPSSPKNEQLQQFLAFAPTLVGVLPPEPTAAAVNWGPSDPSPHRPSNSIQSLLCVWVM